MRDDAFISRVQQLSGLGGRADVMRAIRATLIALGERLRDEERAALTQELPASLRAVFDRTAYAGDFDRDELVARVARHGALDRGRALECAEVVCQALAAELPWEPLTRLRGEVGPLIASLLVEPETPPAVAIASPPSGSTLASGRPGSRRPLSEARLDRAQVFERDGKLIVHADLPGMQQQDVRVNVESDVLTIAGERSHQHEHEKGGVYQCERSFGSFERRIALPEGVAPESVSASFDNGVLEVTMPMPKPSATKGRSIPIQSKGKGVTH